MKKGFYLFLSFLFFFNLSDLLAQNCADCFNMEFEEANTTCWTGELAERVCDGCGTIWPFDRCCYLDIVSVAFDPDRHLITTAGDDPIIGAALPTLSPFGGDYSLRLGNPEGGALGERISRTFTVTPTNKTFSFAYAIVLEDPGHDEEVQPYFKIEMWWGGDEDNKIDCGSYEVIAGGGLPGFTPYLGGDWKEWTKVYVPLDAYVGQDVTIRFTTADCELGAHFAYAYIDPSCTPPELEIDETCDGTILIAPPGALEYHWTNLDNGADLGITTENELAIFETGNYEVDMIVENGCYVSLTGYAQVLTLPLEAIEEHTNLSCFENETGSIEITASNGFGQYEYSIDGGATFSSQNVFNDLSAGVYTVVVQDLQDCETVINDVNITEPDALIMDLIIEDAICYNVCNGEAEVMVDGGTVAGNYSYQWSNGSINVSQIQNLCDGNYGVTASDDNNCEISVEFTIEEPDEVTIETSPNPTICHGGEAVLNVGAEGGSGIYTFYWNGTAGIENLIVDPILTTSYTVQAIDDKGCPSAESTIIVNVLPLLEVTAFKDTAICPYENAPITATASGGNGNYTFIWDNGVGVTQSASVQPPITTTYTVTLTDDCETPDVTDEVTVIIKELPEIDLTLSTIEGCKPLNIDFTNHTDESQVDEMSITLGDETEITGTNDFSHLYALEGTYSLYAYVETVNGCIVDEQYDSLIRVYPLPVAGFYPRPAEKDIYDPSFDFIDESVDAVSYFWNFDDLGTSNKKEPSFVFSDTGYYTIEQVVFNEYACADTIYKTIHVDPVFHIFVPNTFTPNDDALNETFFVKGQGIREETFELFIFDRWGDVIYYSDKYEPWDGTANRKPVKQDVYQYRIYVDDVLGEPHELIGTVNLIR